MDCDLHRSLSFFCPVPPLAYTASQKTPPRSGACRGLCSPGADRRALVDNRAQHSQPTTSCELDRRRRVFWSRRVVVGGVLEKSGKETTRAAERSAVRSCGSGMNAKSNPGHERKDVAVFSLFSIAFLLFLSCVIIFLVVSGLMSYFKFHE